MTRDETIALWQKCEDARAAALAEGKSEEDAHEAAKTIWNEWAQGVKNERNEIFGTNMPLFIPRQIKHTRYGWRKKQTKKVSEWLDEARADFSQVDFVGAVESCRSIVDNRPLLVSKASHRVDFSKYCFPGEADFNGSTFFENGAFYNVDFKCFAWFSAMRFEKGVFFSQFYFFGRSLVPYQQISIICRF